MKVCIIFACCYFFLLTSVAVSAQDRTIQEEDRRPGGARYFIGLENELVMPVNIIGFVNKPGQYIVPEKTDLISLVAFAGGFREDASLKNVKIIRGFTKEGEPNVLKIDLKKYMQKGEKKLLPVLKPDDTVVIAGSKSRTVAKIVNIVRSIGVFAQIYFWIVVARDR